MDDLVDMARGLARKRPGLSSELRPLVTNIIEQADALREGRGNQLTINSRIAKQVRSIEHRVAGDIPFWCGIMGVSVSRPDRG